MAVATLPYPNLDFVPLDILTAAEMNQMVANEQYLAQFANGLATGANIDSNAITSDNIDFETFPAVRRLSAHVGLYPSTATTWTTFGTPINLKAGDRIMISFANKGFASNTQSQLRIMDGSTPIDSCCFIGGASNNLYDGVNGTILYTAPQDITLTLQYRVIQGGNDNTARAYVWLLGRDEL